MLPSVWRVVTVRYPPQRYCSGYQTGTSAHARQIHVLKSASGFYVLINVIFSPVRVLVLLLIMLHSAGLGRCVNTPSPIKRRVNRRTSSHLLSETCLNTLDDERGRKMVGVPCGSSAACRAAPAP
jgi:hypothetical protein